MEEVYWKVIGTIIALCTLYMAFTDVRLKRQKYTQAEKDEQQGANTGLALKVKEIEGKIATQYSLLSTKIEGLERAFQESKGSNYNFETRLVSTMDKLDNKLESLKDLVINNLVTNKNK